MRRGGSGGHSKAVGWLKAGASISCQAGDWLFFRDHIQLVPMLAIPYIIHILNPLLYHSSMCMCKRYRISLLEELQTFVTSDRLSIPMGHFRALRLYRDLLRRSEDDREPLF